jgi:hypothetical protein
MTKNNKGTTMSRFPKVVHGDTSMSGGNSLAHPYAAKGGDCQVSIREEALELSKVSEKQPVKGKRRIVR